jgi:hypothetical protein
MPPGVCDICGKVLRSTSHEAMAAHQLESSTCIPPVSAHAPKAIKDAEAALRAVVLEGQRLHANGTFEEIERNAKHRAEAAQALKSARLDAKSEKQNIRDLASASMSAAGWTQALREGESARFAKATLPAVDQKLAAATVGLVSSSDFRQKREILVAEEEHKILHAEEAARERKRAKKQKLEMQQRRGLSFEEHDEG